ncbi:MAG: aminoglycoside phosphotransferase family protein [Chloroflexota bacterium]
MATAQTQPGGFSPGVAARLQTTAGQRAFLKAVSPLPNALAPSFHRREARVARLLPASAPAPRVLQLIEDDLEGWVALLIEDVEGVQPAVPWDPGQLARVIAAMNDLAAALTPSPISAEEVGTAAEFLARNGTGWQRLLDESSTALDQWSRRNLPRLAALAAEAPQRVTGDSLLHFDIRADNVLLTPEQVYFVDWPHARVGPAWFDFVITAPSVAMQGGLEPEEFLGRSAAAAGADERAVDAAIAGVAAFFTWHALQPDPPGLPTLRSFQAAQADVARRWLADRLDWR